MSILMTFHRLCTPPQSLGGWILSRFFSCFIVVSAFLSLRSIPRPVILYVDGHSTNISLDASRFFFHPNTSFCIVSPSNCTRILQPADVGLFAALKAAWEEAKMQWQLKNIGVCLTKSTLMGFSGRNGRRPQHWKWHPIVSDVVCGLFPLSEDAIDVTRLGSKLTSQPHHKTQHH